jgi:hypothetical protein
MRAADEEGRRRLLARSRRFRRRGIIKSFRTWCVTGYGVVTLLAPVDYYIKKVRLDEPWWHDQLAAKNWVIIEDFDAALAFARMHFGIQTQEPATAGGDAQGCRTR